jgi:hypothetical protein
MRPNRVRKRTLDGCSEIPIVGTRLAPAGRDRPKSEKFRANSGPVQVRDAKIMPR